jgi:hypothetical protein
MAKPSWSSGNLKRHYDDHPVKECACWEKLTGIQPGPIPMNSYEAESHSVLQNSWLNFRASYQRGLNCDPSQVEYFCDLRKCLTAVHVESEEIKTCFHVHTNGDCDLPSSFSSKLQMLKYWIGKKTAFESRITNPRVIKYSVSPDERKRLRTFLDEMTLPGRTMSTRK